MKTALTVIVSLIAWTLIAATVGICMPQWILG